MSASFHFGGTLSLTRSFPLRGAKTVNDAWADLEWTQWLRNDLLAVSSASLLKDTAQLHIWSTTQTTPVASIQYPFVPRHISWDISSRSYLSVALSNMFRIILYRVPIPMDPAVRITSRSNPKYPHVPDSERAGGTDDSPASIIKHSESAVAQKVGPHKGSANDFGSVHEEVVAGSSTLAHFGDDTLFAQVTGTSPHPTHSTHPAHGHEIVSGAKS